MQNHATIPPAQQRPSRTTTTIITTTVTGTLAFVTVLEDAALVEVDLLPEVPVFVLLPLFVSLAAPFHPVTVAEAGTNGTWAVAVPSMTSATLLLTVIHVEAASVPQP
jgi:hypothetical protein